MTTAVESKRSDNLCQLQESLARRILILDGAMGAMLQRHRLTESDYRGSGRFADWSHDLKGNNDLLVLTQPASHYGASSRPYPSRLPVPKNSRHYLVKSVTTAGTCRFRKRLIYNANALTK